MGENDVSQKSIAINEFVCNKEVLLNENKILKPKSSQTVEQWLSGREIANDCFVLIIQNRLKNPK